LFNADESSFQDFNDSCIQACFSFNFKQESSVCLDGSIVAGFFDRLETNSIDTIRYDTILVDKRAENVFLRKMHINTKRIVFRWDEVSGSLMTLAVPDKKDETDEELLSDAELDNTVNESKRIWQIDNSAMLLWQK
jgi:hypothetical protein